MPREVAEARLNPDGIQTVFDKNGTSKVIALFTPEQGIEEFIKKEPDPCTDPDPAPRRTPMRRGHVLT